MTELYPFQEEDVQVYVKHNGVILEASEMGGGKGVKVVVWLKRYVLNGRKRRPVVVICPASIKWNWQAEAARHAGLRAEVLSGRTPPPRRTMTDHPDLYVINYDILGGLKTTRRTWSKFFKSIKPQVLVCDEAHYLSSRTSQRTKFVQELSKDIPQRVMMSGTPMTNRPAELWPLLNILWPEKFNSFWKFGNKFCSPKKSPWGWDFSGASNLLTLHRTLAECGMVRRLRKDVLKDLPAKIRQVQLVDLPDMKQYREAEQDFIAWLKASAPDRASSARRSERLVRTGALKKLAGELKVPVVKSWIDSFLREADGKLIAFAHHRGAVVEPLHTHFRHLSVMVHGGVSDVRRKEAFNSFLADKRLRLLVGNIQAAGVGWSARGVGTVLFAELAWTPGAMSQAEDRISGIGRGVPGEPPLVYYLIARNTIEEKILKILQGKGETAAVVVDGKKTALDLNVYDLLEQEYLHESA